MDVEQVKTELRKEVRALALAESLKGYALVCCMEDITESEMLEILSLRVIRMTEPALATVRQRTGYDFKKATPDVLWVLAEEAHRVMELVQGKDMALLGAVKDFLTMDSTGTAN